MKIIIRIREVGKHLGCQKMLCHTTTRTATYLGKLLQICKIHYEFSKCVNKS